VLERDREHLVDRLDGMERDLLAHLLGDVVQVALVALGKDDLLETGAMRGGSTRPCSVTSPVIPTVLLTGVSESSEAIAVTIVTPALGPSLGTAPAGTCTWNRPPRFDGSIPSSRACERT
jgi:hypothetical protein